MQCQSVPGKFVRLSNLYAAEGGGVEGQSSSVFLHFSVFHAAEGSKACLKMQARNSLESCCSLANISLLPMQLGEKERPLKYDLI